MNILNKVTWQSLRKNPTRTVVTVIGVMLSAAMLCAVMTSASSFMHYLKEDTIYNDGNWHGRVQGTNTAAVQQIDTHPAVAEAGAVQELGYGKLTGALDEDRPYLYVLGDSGQAPSFLPIRLKSGRYPVSPQEILLPENLAPDSGIVHRIGDEMTLELGDRIYDGKKMTQQNPCRLYADGKLQFNGEVLEVRETRTYTVVGFYERLGPRFESYNSPGYTAFTMADIQPKAPYAYDVYFRLKQPKDFSHLLESGAFPIEARLVEGNTNLLMFYGQAPYDGFTKMMYSMAAIVVALILFGSVSLIYNAFSISVSERTKQFGLLSSIGATKKQLRHSVLFEAFTVSLIGIPLGVLAGIGGMAVTFLFVGDKFKSMGFSTALHLHVDGFHILVTVLLALLTVLLSAWVPSKRAAKVSAVEAIRQSRDIRPEKKPNKKSGPVYTLFGLPGVLAGKYYRRSKRKYRATVVSLFMSIVLFISAFSFTDYLMESVDSGMSKAGFDLSVYYDPHLSGNISEEEFLSKIKALDTVKAAATNRHRYIDIWASKDILTEKVLSEKHIWTGHGGGGDRESSLQIACVVDFVDEESFRQLLRDNGLDEKAFTDPEKPLAVALDGNALYNGHTQRYERVHFFKPDHFDLKTVRYKAIEGYWFSEEIQDNNGNRLAHYIKDNGQDGEAAEQEYLDVPVEEAAYEATLTAGAVIEKAPYYVDVSTPTVFLYPMSAAAAVLPDASIEGDSCRVYMTSSDHRKTHKQLNAMIEENHLSADRVYNYAENVENSRNVVTIFRVFSYGFIVLISLIAAANVFNTITTNLNLRRREFAMLKSIGMTKKEFRRMMNYECLLYGGRALLYGLPVSVGVTYLIWKSTGYGFETGFRLPWIAIGVAVCSVFAVVFAAMLYTMWKIRKENLLDVLKNENV